jgi:hypothetical protein
MTHLMVDPVQALLAQTSLKTTAFPANSRYYGVETSSLVTPQGATVVYLQRRFLPRSEGATVIAEHTVVEGDRLDNLAASFLGDPTLFWRLCDANDAMRPSELTETVGRSLVVTLPPGVNGANL